MTKSKYTQGPWEVEVYANSTAVEGKFTTVCSDVTNADANLIAAAPELLQVLKNLVSSIPLNGNSLAVEKDVADACRLITRLNG